MRLAVASRPSGHPLQAMNTTVRLVIASKIPTPDSAGSRAKRIRPVSTIRGVRRGPWDYAWRSAVTKITLAPCVVPSRASATGGREHRCHGRQSRLEPDQARARSRHRGQAYWPSVLEIATGRRDDDVMPRWNGDPMLVDRFRDRW